MEKTPQVLLRLIGGRRWRIADPRALTIEHDGVIERCTRQANLHTLQRQNAETNEQFMVRVYCALVDSEQVLPLLGALLLPEEVERWTPEQARQTVEFLRPLTTSDDKMQMRFALITFLADFFVDGLLSGTPSPTASPENSPAVNATASERSSSATGVSGSL